MKKKETSLNYLEKFLPPGSFDQVAPFFKTHTIHLTLTYERKSVLGDYRHPVPDVPFHRISINCNLNPYSFLITLLHEIAHLVTFTHFQNKAAPHGKEWKAEFRKILIPFIGKTFFPPDVEKALLAYIHNPAASTCTDPQLYKALYRYDVQKPGFKLVDEIPENAFFEIEDGQVFQKLEKVRTRTRCQNVKNKKIYFVQGIMEVKEVKDVKK
jgi:hypothetical protein